jgi:hypothetical protein
MDAENAGTAPWNSLRDFQVETSMYFDFWH